MLLRGDGTILKYGLFTVRKGLMNGDEKLTQGRFSSGHLHKGWLAAASSLLWKSAPVFVKYGSSKALLHEFNFTKHRCGPRRNIHAHFFFLILCLTFLILSPNFQFLMSDLFRAFIYTITFFMLEFDLD